MPLAVISIISITAQHVARQQLPLFPHNSWEKILVENNPLERVFLAERAKRTAKAAAETESYEERPGPRVRDTPPPQPLLPCSSRINSFFLQVS